MTSVEPHTVVKGVSNVGLHFRGVTSPYFGRGAISRFVWKKPECYKGEFYLLANGIRIARSENQEIVAQRDFNEEFRVDTFKYTKLPYDKTEVTAENYVNLAFMQQLTIELDSVSAVSDGYIEQHWAQLVDKKTGEPLVKHPYNLVAEKEYIPPQIRVERALKARDEKQPLICGFCNAPADLLRKCEHGCETFYCKADPSHENVFGTRKIVKLDGDTKEIDWCEWKHDPKCLSQQK